MKSTNQTLGAGKEILAYCGKCKLTLAHIIVVMKNAKEIAKCECKTCKSQHAYRDAAASLKKIVKKAVKKESYVPIEQAWRQALNQTKNEPQKYSMDTIYNEGDVILHPTFGKGVVNKKTSDHKIDVIFERDLKTLICGG